MSKKIQLLLVSAFAFLVVACSDDSDPPKYPVLQEGVIDVVNGYNSIIIDLDKLENIQLHTDRDVTLENSNKFVNFEVIKEGGKRYIKPTLKKDISEIKPFMTKLKIKVQSYLNSRNGSYEEAEAEMNKDLYISFRRTTAAPDNVDVNYARAIGKGTKPWGDMGNVTYPILDFDAIYEHIGKNENLAMKSLFFETSGERYESSLKKIAANLGIQGTLPIPTEKGIILLSAGASWSGNWATSRASYYESYMGYYGKKMSEVRLNMDWVENQGSLSALLDKTVNDVLNNPNTNAYKKYNNDQSGIFALLEQYGPHVITKATFGGNYTVLYVREENAYDRSVGHDAGVSITVSKPGASKNWLEYYKSKTGSPKVTTSGDGSDYRTNSNEASKSFHVVMAKGGNASQDMESWDKSMTIDSKDTWIPISYFLEGDSEENTGLVPISELVVDSTRKKAIEMYLEDFILKQAVPVYDSPMVVVDFMMKTGPNGREDGTPTPFIEKDPFGVYRWYYPLMANSNAPADHGYALETSNQDYIVAADYSDHYWYYALGHIDEESGFYGITDVQFAEKGDLGEEWTLRGDHSHSDIHGVMDKRYVHLKYAKAGTAIDSVIKAIGLSKVNGKDTVDTSAIIASTGGSEMTVPFSIDTRFGKYWGGTDEDSVATGARKHMSEWFANSGLKQKCDFNIVYSTKNLDVNFCFGDGNAKGQINHPKKWGE